jgi:hypothetical protein
MTRQGPLFLLVSEAKQASFWVDSLPCAVIIIYFLNGAKAFSRRLIAASLTAPHHGSRAKRLRVQAVVGHHDRWATCLGLAGIRVGTHHGPGPEDNGWFRLDGQPRNQSSR